MSLILSCSYNYARDRYLGNILKNFIRTSISIKEHNVNMLIKIHKSEIDET